MAMEYLCLFHDYRRKFAGLNNEEFGKVIRAALLYSETDEITQLLPIETLAFDVVRCDIDRAKAQYETRCAKNRANGSVRKRSVAIASESSQEKEKEEEEEEERVYKERKADKPPRTRFTPPTIEEVAAYCTERKNNVNPEKFMNHYQANGWVQSRGKPIRDWKAAVRNWESNGYDNARTTNPSQPIQYTTEDFITESRRTK